MGKENTLIRNRSEGANFLQMHIYCCQMEIQVKNGYYQIFNSK